MEDNRLLELIEEHTRKTEINTRKTANYTWVIMIISIICIVGGIYSVLQLT